MQTDPSPPEELIEDVILLSVAICKACPDDVNPEALILLAQRQCCLLELLLYQVLGQRDSLGILILSKCRVVRFRRCLTPGHWGGNHHKNLILFRSDILILEKFQNSVGLIQVAIEL